MNTLFPTRIVIADDHEIYLDGLQRFLARQEGLRIIGRANNGKTLVDLSLTLRPDVVITDIVMPVMSGIVATTLITEKLPDIKCIALSMNNEEDQILKMLEAGARGYLIKNAEKGEILSAIESVSRNIPYYCRSTASRLALMLSQSRHNTKSRLRDFIFSAKELEIIRLICKEKTSLEISKQLYLSLRTVEGYRTKIFDKMGVKSAVGIAMYAMKHGLTDNTE